MVINCYLSHSCAFYHITGWAIDMADSWLWWSAGCLGNWGLKSIRTCGRTRASSRCETASSLFGLRSVSKYANEIIWFNLMSGYLSNTKIWLSNITRVRQCCDACACCTALNNAKIREDTKCRYHWSPLFLSGLVCATKFSVAIVSLFKLSVAVLLHQKKQPVNFFWGVQNPVSHCRNQTLRVFGKKKWTRDLLGQWWCLC